MIIEAKNRDIWLKKLKTGWRGFGDSKVIFESTMEYALQLLEYLEFNNYKNIEIKPSINGDVIFEFFYKNDSFRIITHENQTYTLIKETKPSWSDLRFVNDIRTSDVFVENNLLFSDICKMIIKES